MDKRRDEPDAREALRWQWLSGNIVHRDQWVDLRENTYLLPNGKEITPYYTTRNRNFSVIVARDPEGSYICVRQFRPGTETVTTEFPAGGMEEGEDPLGAAKRELLEETGYEAEQWTALGRIAPNATIANNYAYIFLAEGCRKVSGRHLDATECMETAVLSAEVMDEMIAEYVASRQAAGDSRSMREIAEEYNDTVIFPDKVRLNCFYYRHYSFVKDIQMIFCTVLGRKMKYAGEEI